MFSVSQLALVLVLVLALALVSALVLALVLARVSARVSVLVSVLVFLVSQLDLAPKLYSLLQPYYFYMHPFLEQKHAEPKKESLQLYLQMK